MNWVTVTLGVIEALGPLVLKIVEAFQRGDPDPFASVLGEKVAEIIPARMKSRIALDAIKAHASGGA